MKKIFTATGFLIAVIIMIFTYLVCEPSVCRAYGETENDAQDEIDSLLDDILSEYDIGYSSGELSEISLGNIVDYIKEYAVSRLYAPLKMLGSILVITVFTSVIKSFGEISQSREQSSLCDMVSVMTAVTVILPQMTEVCERAGNTVERTSGFIAVFVPVFTGISVFCGGLTSAGFYNIMILAGSELFVSLSGKYLMPVLSMTTVLGITDSIFPQSSTENLVKFLKKLVTWGISVTMTLFTGFVSLKCTVTGKADSFASKTAKFIISGAVPIVGGAVSDAYSAVRGSFDVIRCTAGAVGVTAVLLIVLPPLIELTIFRLVMWTSTAFGGLLSAEPIVKLVKSFDAGLAIVQCVLVCYAVMFVLCSAILLNSF